MANTVEIVTKLVGARAVTLDLEQIQQALGATGKAGNDAAAGAKKAAQGSTDLSAALKTLRREAANLVGLTALVKFFVEADREAREAARAMQAVATSLTILGHSTRAVGAQVQDTADRLEDLTGIAGGDFQRAFTVLSRITQNAEQSVRLLGVAADVAAGEQIALAQAAEIVGRAAIGQTQPLRRMGIVLREGATAAEALAEIQRRYTGQAEAAVTAVDKLRVAWDRFQETVGTRVQPKVDALMGLLTKMLAVAEKLAATAIFDIGVPRVTVRPGMAPGARAEVETIQELDREMARASAMTTILGRTQNQFLEVERAFDKAMRSTAEQFLLFNDEQARLHAELGASQTLLKAYIDGGLTSLDDRVRKAAANVDGLTAALIRLNIAAEGRMTPGERSARATTATSEAGRRREAAGQAILDTLDVADAERTLEATAEANAHVAAEADRAQAALERVAGAMTKSEATARANANAVERVSQTLSDAEIAMERWTGLTLENMLQVQDASKFLWSSFAFGAADAFAAILVDGESFARKFKDLLRNLASDVVRLFTRMGLERGLFGAFQAGNGMTPDEAALRGLPVTAAGAGVASSAAVGFGLPLAALGAQYLFALGTKLGGGTKEAQLGSGIGGAALGFVTGGLSFLGGGLLGGAFSGAGGRAERRRGSQRDALAAGLASIGVDPALVDVLEAGLGRFGSGGTFERASQLLNVGASAGLKGDLAARGLTFAAHFGTAAPAAQAQLAGLTGGLAGFGPQAAETTRILAAGADETLRNWEKVDAFFQRFDETLQAVGETLDSGVAQGIGGAIQSWLSGASSLFAGIRQGLRAAIESAIIEAIVNGVVIEGILGPALARLRDAIVKGTEDPAAVIREIAGLIPQITSSIQGLVAPLIPALNAVSPPGAGGLGVFPVPAFAAGGIVTAPTLAVIGEAGPEAVVPLGGARGGMTLELHDTIEVDGDVLARVVRRRLPSQIRFADHAGR